MFAASRALSCDVTHAAHPNYLGHHDPVHRAVPNGGPALKVNANQRYATDAPGAAAWARACRDAGVPSQVFVSRNTVPCGSTVGPIIATRLGIRTVDVGIPVLSMHSARELCGVDDPAYLVAAASGVPGRPGLIGVSRRYGSGRPGRSRWPLLASNASRATLLTRARPLRRARGSVESRMLDAGRSA